MALTATRTTRGFELLSNMTVVYSDEGSQGDYILTPGVAFSMGDMLVVTNGKLAKAAAGAAAVIGVLTHDVAIADNPATARVKPRIWRNPGNVYRCSFVDHRDSTATGAGTTTTLVDSGLIGGGDNIWAGALLYIYEGPGAGETRILTASTSASGTLTFTDPLSIATSIATKYILLGVGAAGVNITPGVYGVNLKDEKTIDANATTANEAGPLAVRGINPAELTMDVVIRKHVFS
jgi:hypothetical protein